MNLNDEPDFVCYNLVVDGDPEPLEAAYVPEYDLDLKIVRGVCSSR